MLGVTLAREKRWCLSWELSYLQWKWWHSCQWINWDLIVAPLVMHPNQGKQEYEMSIIVCLQFALSVIVLVKAFIRRLIDRTIGLSAPVHYVTLNEEAKKDLDMRKNFCSFTMAKEFSYHRNWFLVIFRYLLMPQNLHVRQSLISNGLW